MSVLFTISALCVAVAIVSPVIFSLSGRRL
jgi:hypothetical protein